MEKLPCQVHVCLRSSTAASTECVINIKWCTECHRVAVERPDEQPRHRAPLPTASAYLQAPYPRKYQGAESQRNLRRESRCPRPVHPQPHARYSAPSPGRSQRQCAAAKAPPKSSQTSASDPLRLGGSAPPPSPPLSGNPPTHRQQCIILHCSEPIYIDHEHRQGLSSGPILGLSQLRYLNVFYCEAIATKLIWVLGCCSVAGLGAARMLAMSHQQPPRVTGYSRPPHPQPDPHTISLSSLLVFPSHISSCFRRVSSTYQRP